MVYAQKLDRQREELLKQQEKTPPQLTDRIRSVTPKSRDLINAVIHHDSFFDGDFPEEEEMSPDPILAEEFNREPVSTLLQDILCPWFFRLAI